MQNRRKTIAALSHLSDLKVFKVNFQKKMRMRMLPLSMLMITNLDQKSQSIYFHYIRYAALLRHALRGRGLMFMGHCVCDITQKQ